MCGQQVVTLRADITYHTFYDKLSVFAHHVYLLSSLHCIDCLKRYDKRSDSPHSVYPKTGKRRRAIERHLPTQIVLLTEAVRNLLLIEMTLRREHRVITR